MLRKLALPIVRRVALLLLVAATVMATTVVAERARAAPGNPCLGGGCYCMYGSYCVLGGSGDDCHSTWDCDL